MKAWRLAVGVLLVTLFLWPALPAYAATPVQVWVDDGYCSACGNDGHVWNSDAFATISAALRAVAAGGTVHVYPGTYREDVSIAKPVRLVAEGPGVQLAPRLAEVTVLVAANDVSIEGLEVTGGKQAAILAVGPDFQRQPMRNITVRGTIVRGGLFGIAMNIDAAWNYGTLAASGIEISGNAVSGCTRAIYVYNAQAAISGNSVSGLAPEGIGIYSSQGAVSQIKGNTVLVNSPNGRAIYILDNQGTLIDGNSLVGATDVLTPTTAIALYGFGDLVLSNNAILGFYWGTNAYTGGTARIERNSFQNTAAWAISFGSAITTTQVSILDNTIRGSYWGLRLDDDGGNGLQATVRGNDLSDNVVGVQLASSVRSQQVRLAGNAISGNLSAGLRNESEAPIIAGDNWWGTNDGPQPAGSGDRIESVGSVTASPWVRLQASTGSDGSGQTTVTATLASLLYRLSGRSLTFSTTRGTFANSSTTWTATTDSNGEARAVLTLPAGQAGSVTISSARGPVLTISVPAPKRANSGN
ncbi:MAG TPA: hypothetical protein PLJ35_10580 [Anaerolineae bacterium]|nr:hypothetical protein [Anaerolineae bacterium]HOQ99251.1 hypothetical protein [Anaerolineae bacterium]HPL29729.1 hypothetical protein [Anaerolineae bacterium]